MFQNLNLLLPLTFRLEKKREQPDALTVVSGGTPKPELKTYPAEYVAHEVKVLGPNANLDSVSTQEGTSTSPTSGLSAGVLQGDIPTANHITLNNNTGRQQQQQQQQQQQRQQQTNTIGPSLLFIPKRHVLHNVRSAVRDFVPSGRLSLFVEVDQT